MSAVAQCHLCKAIATEMVIEETHRSVGPALLAQIRSVAADAPDIN